jgi:hypothetical protein
MWWKKYLLTRETEGDVKNVEAVGSVIMEDVRPCVKIVVVMGYAITGKKGDIALSAA